MMTGSRSSSSFCHERGRKTGIRGVARAGLNAAGSAGVSSHESGAGGGPGGCIGAICHDVGYDSRRGGTVNGSGCRFDRWIHGATIPTEVTRRKRPDNDRNAGPAVRFGVSMEPGLLVRFDKLIARRGYACRSEALRDLVRRQLDEDRLREEGTEVVGTVSIVYDHEQHDLAHRLTHIQHDHHATVIANVHVHLDPRNCLEVLIVRGQSDQVRKLADELIATRGVRHGRLGLTAAKD